MSNGFDMVHIAIMQTPSLDCRFYTSFYPDLAEFDEERAMQHWLESGQNERRFNDLAAWIAGTPQVSTQLPIEFSVDLYRQFNPDLASTLQHDWEYILHYLKHGQAEGRYAGISSDQFITDLYFDGVTPQPAVFRALSIHPASIAWRF